MRQNRPKMFWLFAASALPLAAVPGNAPRMAPVPADPLELVTGSVQAARTPESRDAALQLLGRARDGFALSKAAQPYHLKIRFTVDSQGQTNYDGAWEMDDVYNPGQGVHWTAKAEAGYNMTAISSKGNFYGEGTASAIPLRLHEARGLLNRPIASDSYAKQESIRTATASFRGTTLTCVLLTRSRNAVNPATGRGWEEAEECIDPQSGLLQVHSEVPGRYVVYDYENGPQLGGHVLPRSVTVSEAGRVVSKLSVESIESTAPADARMFRPTDAMMSGGPSTAMGGATKLTRVHGDGPVTGGLVVRPVCVFGLVTPSGQLVEAHSLQPSDPNSDAAIEDAKSIDYSPATATDGPPRQHFVFVIEKFLVAQ